MRRPLVLTVLLLGLAIASPAAAERAAIVAVDLGNGVPEFMRGKALASVKEGLIAAGFEVSSTEQVTPKLQQNNLAQCRTGPCLSNVGKLVEAPWLVLVSVTRKDESTIIVMRLVDAKSAEARAEVHEVCDLCGQSELDDRINVAASALRVKAEAERQRASGSSQAAAAGKIRVAVIPSIAVNVDAARVDSLGQDLADALAAELEVTAVGGLEVRRQLPPDGVQADCVTTPACVTDVAKRTSANQLLFIVLVNTGTGGSIQVDSTWVDPATGRTATRRPVDVVSPESARGTFAASAKQLLPDAPVRPKGPTGGFGGKMSDAVPRHFTTPAKIAGAVAIVGLGVGIGVGLSVRGKYNDCDAAPATCSQSERDSIRNLGFVADFGFLVATAGAVTTGILWATSGKESQLIVSPTPTGAAVSFSGRF